MSYILINPHDEIRLENAYGDIPSPQILRLGHRQWWAVFMSLVGKMPRKAESSRLSDDPVHIVSGQYYSLRDCAMRAIDAAYAENLEHVAHDYEEQAKQLIYSYDKRVYIRVSRVFDKLRMKYLVICSFCMLIGVLLAFLFSMGEKKSAGLIVLISAALFFAVSSGVMAFVTTWKKRRILYQQPSHDAKRSDDNSGIKTIL